MMMIEIKLGLNYWQAVFLTHRDTVRMCFLSNPRKFCIKKKSPTACCRTYWLAPMRSHEPAPSPFSGDRALWQDKPFNMSFRWTYHPKLPVRRANHPILFGSEGCDSRFHPTVARWDSSILHHVFRTAGRPHSAIQLVGWTRLSNVCCAATIIRRVEHTNAWVTFSTSISLIRQHKIVWLQGKSCGVRQVNARWELVILYYNTFSRLGSPSCFGATFLTFSIFANFWKNLWRYYSTFGAICQRYS